jgi:Na+/proline symporter
MMYGLHPIDLAVIAAYFAVVTAVGFWAARRVRGEQDYFMGGRRFGKGLLVMHWLCTGTHSEQAVQVCGAAARVGLGGIWYQWMWLFSTPFYWFIAPITRRLRVTTTGDFFRIRYGRSLEMLYTVVALGYFVLSVGMLLRGAGLAIAGATGGQVPGDWAVIGLSLLFATYIVAGGLIAAAYTDFLQGMFIIVLSVMLVPAGLSVVGGLHGLHAALPPNMFGMTAPRGAPAGDPWFVAAMSALGLAGIIAQPHVMTATGSGKTELEARVGMVYGNFIKRLLTIAWALTGLVAAAAFAGELGAHQAGSLEHVHASEELFGRSVRRFLGTGWRGLMVASLVAGVTSAETLMVVGSAVFTRNLYAHLVPRRSDRHYLWTGRAAGAGMLGAGILFGLYGGSVTWLYTSSVQMIGSAWCGAAPTPPRRGPAWQQACCSGRRAAPIRRWCAGCRSLTRLRQPWYGWPSRPACGSLARRCKSCVCSPWSLACCWWWGCVRGRNRPACWTPSLPDSLHPWARRLRCAHLAPAAGRKSRLRSACPRVRWISPVPRATAMPHPGGGGLSCLASAGSTGPASPRPGCWYLCSSACWPGWPSWARELGA